MLCVMRRKSVVHISLVLTVACTTGRSELVSHYRLDEAVRDPGSVVDSVGGKDGTLINPDRVAREIYPAPFLAAYDFQPDVSLGGGVNLGTNAAVRPQANWTATWWVQLDTLNAFDRMFESMNGTAATSRGIRFDLGGSGNHVRILLRDGSGQQIPLEHTRVLSTGTWYFVAARYRPADGDRRRRVSWGDGRDRQHARGSERRTGRDSVPGNSADCPGGRGGGRRCCKCPGRPNG